MNWKNVVFISLKIFIGVSAAFVLTEFVLEEPFFPVSAEVKKAELEERVNKRITRLATPEIVGEIKAFEVVKETTKFPHTNQGFVIVKKDDGTLFPATVSPMREIVVGKEVTIIFVSHYRNGAGYQSKFAYVQN